MHVCLFVNIGGKIVVALFVLQKRQQHQRYLDSDDRVVLLASYEELILSQFTMSSRGTCQLPGPCDWCRPMSIDVYLGIADVEVWNTMDQDVNLQISS